MTRRREASNAGTIGSGVAICGAGEKSSGAHVLGGTTASCRRSEHVVGGGASVTTNDVAYLTGSRPIDDGDRKQAPDDGWRAVLDSASATPAQIEALAICRR